MGLPAASAPEHGLGQLKRETIRAHKTLSKLELMLGSKRVLDPGGLMNPGKVCNCPPGFRVLTCGGD